VSKNAGSRYAEKKRLKLGGGKRDPRWMWWAVSFRENDEGRMVERDRAVSAVPLNYGKRKRRAA